MKKVGRNDLCQCGSSKKYKNCCLEYDKKIMRSLNLIDLTVFDKFQNIDDPRSNIGKEYRLIDLIIMTIYGILCGQDFTNIAYFLKVHDKYFKKLLNIDKTPSHDCLTDLFAVINPKSFMEIFVEWMEEIIEHQTGITAIDGKALRNAYNKSDNEAIPYMVSAYLSELKISIGEVRIDDKSNEKKAIPKLLELICIKGSTITMDAMGTTLEIANLIIENEGHYVLKLKDNQKKLLEEIKTFFDLADDEDKIEIFETEYEKNHGRIEKRTYYLSYNIDMISNKKWKSIKAIGKVTVYRDDGKVITKEDSYFIADTQIEMELFVRAIRAHWNIECSLHWVLDVILNEDQSRNRVKNSASNLSVIRKIAYNLARLDTTFGDNLPLKRKITNYNADFTNVEKLIFNAISLF